MILNLKETLTVIMLLFAVIDVVGSIPVLIDLENRIGKINSRKASLASLIIMLSFFFIGDSLLEVVGIDIQSFAIAGSIVLFFLALEMILGIRLYKDTVPNTASIVPVAFPLIAGAGTLSTMLSLKSHYSSQSIIVAVCINVLFVYLVLSNTKRIASFLGTGGIEILRKIFGILLLAIAVKLFQTNIKM
jgi:multiple antibiotic resistance protein